MHAFKLCCYPLDRTAYADIRYINFTEIADLAVPARIRILQLGNIDSGKSFSIDVLPVFGGPAGA